MVVAAGGLEPDPLASAMGTPRKALAPVAGRASLARVLDAVKEAGLEDCVTAAGPDTHPWIHWGAAAPEGGTGVESVAHGVDALDPACEAVLILPSDAPAMDGPMMRAFLDAVERRRNVERDVQRWYAAGICTLAAFESAYPGYPVHPLRLREGRFLSGALFALSRAGFRHGVGVFDAMRQSRRSQLGMIRRLGPGPLVRYLAGRIALADAEAIIGRLLDGAVWVVPGMDPATCLDFDDADEYALIEPIVAAGT